MDQHGRWRQQPVACPPRVLIGPTTVVGTRRRIADIPAQDRAFLLDVVKAFVADAPLARSQRSGAGRPRLAILWDPDEPHKPSNEEALQRMLKAAPASSTNSSAAPSRSACRWWTTPNPSSSA
jgi:hypothetical protein